MFVWTLLCDFYDSIRLVSLNNKHLMIDEVIQHHFLIQSDQQTSQIIRANEIRYLIFHDGSTKKSNSKTVVICPII